MPFIELMSTGTTRPTTAAGVSNTGTVIDVVPRINIPPIQLPGFAPLYDCDANECRQPNDQTCCHVNNVFGNLINGEAVRTSTYENDWNTFGVDLKLFTQNPDHATATWVLQKCSGSDVWTTVSTLNNNTYGNFYALNSIPLHHSYTIYYLNWGKVLKIKGEGTYRIKVSNAMRSITGCRISDSFFLRQFNCLIADGTVKFESLNTGKIGSHYGRGKIFDLCGINYFDSIRLRGEFGKETVPEYLQKIDEFQNGDQNLYSDEAIQKYEFQSKLWPKEYHDRLKIYFMMANTRLVSDYNRFNPDYTIKQFSIIKDAGYEPKYFTKNRNQTVKITFKAGTQNIIKSLCCSVNR